MKDLNKLIQVNKYYNCEPGLSLLVTNLTDKQVVVKGFDRIAKQPVIEHQMSINDFLKLNPKPNA